MDAQEYVAIDGKEDYTTYVMKWYEDLSIVAERFGVSEEDILKYNSLSSAKDAKQVKKLKIPNNTQPKDEGKSLGEILDSFGKKIDQALAPIDTTAKADPQTEKTPVINFADIFKVKAGPEANMALILPFSGDGSSDSYLDFYSGVLMAVRDLGRSGMKMNLSVYDFNADADKIQRTDLGKFDFIVGPVSKDQVEAVLHITPENTLLVSPLDHKTASLADSCSHFIQAPSTSERQYEDAVAWLNEELLPGDIVYLLKEKNAPATPAEKYMQLSGTAYKTIEYGILEGRDIQEMLENGLKEGDRVRAIVSSESEAFVNDAVRNLSLMTFHKFDVSLYGVSKMKNWETIESEALHNVHFHMSTSYHVDYCHSKIKNFLMEYRALFNCEPGPFAYQGYDLISYLVTFRTRYRGSWIDKLDKERFRGLQSDYLLEHKDFGGFSNKAIRRVIYGNEYSITLQN